MNLSYYQQNTSELNSNNDVELSFSYIYVQFAIIFD